MYNYTYTPLHFLITKLLTPMIMHTPLTHPVQSRHYLPLLAKYIVEKNTMAPPGEQLNLKGFLVGNPSTVCVCIWLYMSCVS